jgi:intracellular septation protein
MFDSLFSLPDYAWTRLATCWGIYFIAMAGWNEILVATVSEDTWANWKLGNMVIGLVFVMSLVPYTLKHTISETAKDAG